MEALGSGLLIRRKSLLKQTKFRFLLFQPHLPEVNVIARKRERAGRNLPLTLKLREI
jgi:hypothetical protein